MLHSKKIDLLLLVTTGCTACAATMLHIMEVMEHTRKFLMDTYDLESQKIAEPKANDFIADIIVKPV
jgi:hypothetical protein